MVVSLNSMVQPIWSEREKSSVQSTFNGGSIKSKSHSHSFYPQRVPLNSCHAESHNTAAAAEELKTSPGLHFDSEIESSLDKHLNNHSYSSSDSDAEATDEVISR